MTRPIESGSFSQPAVDRGASFRQLARAIWLVGRVLVPIAVLCVIELGALQLLYLRNPDRTDKLRYLTVDYFIVLEQIRRAATVPAPDIGFFGDSSCLMGVDPRIVERALGRRPVQSFCAIGYVGPVGYSYMLDSMISRNAAPKVVVFMFHPDTFRRDPSWEAWPWFVKSGGVTSTPPLRFPHSALDYLRFEWLGRLLYSPLPGAYRLYYGDEGAFRASIDARQGSAIDPSQGLNVLRLDALKAVASPPYGKATDFSANQAYRDALKVLGETIKKLPAGTPVYLIISPVIDFTVPPAALVQRAEREKEIATALGIDADHILKTPATMFLAYFSSGTHLNRWGQQVFSSEFAKQLAAKKPANK